MKKRFFITFFIFLILFSGAFLFVSKYLDVLEAGSKKDVIKGVDLGENNVIEQVVDDEILFLLTGVDENFGDDPKDRSRTDTMMLVKVNLKVGSVDIISLPRDTQVLIQGEWDKLNHAHAYGGMALTMRTIRDWLNIDLDYYVKMNYRAVEELVDAMGGIVVDVPVPMHFDPIIGVDLEPGEQRLTGYEALYFVRYREGYENGDIGRVETQQYFMKQLLKQMLSVQNIPNLGKFYTSYINNVDTNIPTSTILGMLPLAGNIDFDEINTYMIPGTDGMENDISYYFYNKDETDDLVYRHLYDYLLD